MQIDKNVLSERLLRFAAATIKMVSSSNKTFAGRHIAGQLIRSATSAGANYEETCGAESRADFIHKMQIVLKELRESLYWLRLIKEANLIPKSQEILENVLLEAKELTNIIAKSVVTAKKQ